MRTKRTHRVLTWFEELAMGVSGFLRPPDPILVPIRVEQAHERDLIERRKLLARSLPRMPPLE